MYYYNLFAGKRYYLQLLFIVLHSLTSFENIQIIDKYLHLTYQSTCMALGLLKNDRKWVNCFNEILQFLLRKTMQTLFISILTHGSVSHPAQLWK